MATRFEKLEQIESRYEGTHQANLLARGAFRFDVRYQKLARTHADLSHVVEKYRQWKQIEQGLRETKQMLVESEDAEIMQLAHEEERLLVERKEIVERELKSLLLPKDPHDDKNVILEIRAGTGGDEAALFAAELFRMPRATPNRKGGASKFWRARPLPSEALRTSSRLFRATRFIPS